MFPCLLFFEHAGGFVVLHTLIDLPPELSRVLESSENRTSRFLRKSHFFSNWSSTLSVPFLYHGTLTSETLDTSTRL